MRRTSLETCCTRSEMAQPCWGPMDNVLRMRRSRVPCGRSIFDGDNHFPFCFYTSKYAISCRSARGKTGRCIQAENRGTGLGNYTFLRFMDQPTPESRSSLIDVPVHNFIDNFTMTKGRHTLGAGA